MKGRKDCGDLQNLSEEPEARASNCARCKKSPIARESWQETDVAELNPVIKAKRQYHDDPDDQYNSMQKVVSNEIVGG